MNSGVLRNNGLRRLERADDSNLSQHVQPSHTSSTLSRDAQRIKGKRDSRRKNRQNERTITAGVLQSTAERRNTSDASPVITLEYDWDDDLSEEEETPSLEEEPIIDDRLDWVQFNYEYVSHVFYVFSMRRIGTGYLPKRIIDHLWSQLTIINSLNNSVYNQFLKTDPTILSFTNYWFHEDYAQYERILVDLKAFYFHYDAVDSKTDKSLGWASSKYCQYRRDKANSMNKPVPVDSDNWFKAFLRVSVSAIALYMTFRHTRNYFRSLYAGVDPGIFATLVPTFPVESMLLQDYLSRFPAFKWCLDSTEYLTKYPSVIEFNSRPIECSLTKQFVRHMNFNICMAQNRKLSQKVYFPKLQNGEIDDKYYLFVKFNNVEGVDVWTQIHQQHITIEEEDDTEEDDIHPTIFKNYQTASIYLEETIKCVPYGYWIVSFIERLQNGDWRTFKWHKRTANMPYSSRVKYHFNYVDNVCQANPLLESYRMFVNTNKDHYPEIVEYCPVLPTRDLPILPHTVTKSFRYASIGNLEELKYPKKETYWYPLCYLANRMVVNSNSVENCYATVDSRIKAYENSKFQSVNAPVVIKFKQLLTELPTVSPTHIPNWREKLKSVQKQNLLEAEDNRLNSVTFKHIQLIPKLDEKIISTEKCVPRALTNQSKEEFYAMGQLTSEFSETFSNFLFDQNCSNAIVHNGYTFYFYFTCGATSQSIEHFLDKISHNHCIGVLIMGDDTLAYLGDNNSWIENDFSRYDRTQHRGLRACINEYFRRCGANDLVEARNREYNKTLKLKLPSYARGAKKLPVVDKLGKRVDMRYTGEAATCLDNSLVNIMSFIASFTLSAAKTQVGITVDLKQMEANMKILGLVPKLSRPYFPTFLKGVILVDHCGKKHWQRLPSFLLKFGALLTPKETIFKNSHLTQDQMARCLLRAQWLSYGNMRVNWMYVQMDDLIHKYCPKTPLLSLKIQETIQKEVELQQWQVVASSDYFIDDDTWNSFLLSRYKMEKVEVELFLTQFETALKSPMPNIYASNNFMHKLLVDY